MSQTLCIICVEKVIFCQLISLGKVQEHMSIIAGSRKEIYRADSAGNGEAQSETELQAKPTLISLIKQTTLNGSRKPEIAESRNPLSLLKKALTRSNRNDGILCHICEMTYEEKQVTKICSCDHIFCKICIESYLNYKINTFKKIGCPQEKCEGVFSKESQGFLSLPIEMKKKYEKNLKFIEANKNPNLRQCHEPNCEGYFDTSVEPCFCEVCQASYCPKCNFKAHTAECQDYQIEFLQNKYKFRQCNSCKNMIEKNQGCNHIVCRCGHNFCYLCGADWATDPCRSRRHVELQYNRIQEPQAEREAHLAQKNNNRRSFDDRLLLSIVQNIWRQLICTCPQRNCLGWFFFLTLKIPSFFIYCCVALPLGVAFTLLILVGALVISCVIGGVKLYIQSIQGASCARKCCLTLILPLILIGGVFWYFFKQANSLRQCLKWMTLCLIAYPMCAMKSCSG